MSVLSLEGTHIGEFLGMPPTGKRFTMPAVFFYQLENGKIVRERRIYDFTGLLVQIGVIKAKPSVAPVRATLATRQAPAATGSCSRDSL